MTTEIGTRVAYYRKRATRPDGKKLTVQALADRCSALGLPLGRVTIAKLESGLRQGITPAEVLVLAAALDVAPTDLLLPIAGSATTEALPGLRVGTWEALRMVRRHPQAVTAERRAGRVHADLRSRNRRDRRQPPAQAPGLRSRMGRPRTPSFVSPGGELDAETMDRQRASLRLIREPIEEVLGLIRAEMSRRDMLLPDLPEDLHLALQARDGD